MRTMLVLLHCDGDGNVVPEIHTVNATGFGSTNMGTAAIDVFFKTHEWYVQSLQESVQKSWTDKSLGFRALALTVTTLHCGRRQALGCPQP